jgi:hypothetical protein
VQSQSLQKWSIGNTIIAVLRLIVGKVDDRLESAGRRYENVRKSVDFSESGTKSPG